MTRLKTDPRDSHPFSTTKVHAPLAATCLRTGVGHSKGWQGEAHQGLFLLIPECLGLSGCSCWLCKRHQPQHQQHQQEGCHTSPSPPGGSQQVQTLLVPHHPLITLSPAVPPVLLSSFQNHFQVAKYFGPRANPVLHSTCNLSFPKT